MVKIAHIQVIPKLSGAQKFSLNILSNLNCYDKYIICSSVEVVTDEQLADFKKEMAENNITIIWSQYLKRGIGIDDIRCLKELYQIFRKHKFDIVHTNSTKPGVLARIASRLAGCKRILHTVHGIAYHDQESYIKRMIYYVLEIIALQFGTYNVTVNNFYLKYYRPFFWKKSLRIYNGIDFVNLNKSMNIPPKVNTNKKVLFVGRLDYQKNPLGAIKAFKEILKHNNNITFDIVGDGELREECEKLVTELKLNEYIKFHGWVAEPEMFYRRSDVFFCPSLYEAFGFTFVEAAFYGLPIVASNVEGIPEVVKNGHMGFLCDSENYINQAKSILNILENDELANQFGAAGREFVTQNFTLERCVSEYKALYQKMLGDIK